jgi:hypothetical protein
MFEKSLSDRLKRIFDLKKATFDLPSESQEQECLFIEVVSSKNQVTDAKFKAKVTGKIRVFCNTDKLPYGYFSKKIAEADPEDTKDLFFYDIEENNGTFLNIAERTMSFIYLFDGQYNPDIGDINQLISEIAFEGT